MMCENIMVKKTKVQADTVVLRPREGIMGPLRMGDRVAVLKGRAEVEMSTGNTIADYYSPSETYAQVRQQHQMDSAHYFTNTRGNNALIPVHQQRVVRM
jgi:hypothetical protein